MTIYDSQLYHTGFTKITPDEIGSILGRDLSDDETSYLTALIPALELSFARACNRNFLLQPYFEYFPGDSDMYSFGSTPVSEITKIVVSGQTMYEAEGEGENEWNLNEHFFVYPEKLILSSALAIFPPYNALRVEYSLSQFWGHDVRIAIIQWVQDMLQKKDYAGRSLKKYSFASLSLEFAGEGADIYPSYVSRVVESYKKICI